MNLLLEEIQRQGWEKVAELQRARDGKTLEQEAADLAGSLAAFVRAGWYNVWPNERYVHGRHIDAISEHLEAVSAGEIRYLQIWVPPGSSKSTVVSIMWPAWEWAREPWIRILSASYGTKLAEGFAGKSRDLIRSEWYQARWPLVQMKRDHDLKTSYATTAGGERFSTSPSGTGTGKHAHRIIIDDAINAKEVTSEATLEAVREWYDGTIALRHIPGGATSEVIIQQRLAERDLAGHVLAVDPEAWTVLCLPEEYEPAHPYAWAGDWRKEPGELLWPEVVNAEEHARRALKLASFKAAGQLQQRPAAREGAILKRALWRFYPPQMRDESDETFVARLPRFSAIWQSWDTSLKDSSQSDFVAGTVWGQQGANLYLLPEGRHVRLGLSATKTAIRQVSAWVDERWPRLPQRILIEKTANGPEVIAELRQSIRGIIPTSPSVGADKPAVAKTIRAEAAEPALEGGNIYVPGLAAPDLPEGYDPGKTWAIAQELIEQCASFPLGDHDDLVDSFTQVVNWTRGRKGSGSISVPRGRAPEAGALAGISSWDRIGA